MFLENRGKETYTIYDGAIIFDNKGSAVNTALGIINSLIGTKFHLSPQNVKADREAGCHAMWPLWFEEVEKGTSLEAILEWIESVYVHQSRAVQNFHRANTENSKIRSVLP